MARKIYESKTLQEFGDFDYRIVEGGSQFTYEVHGDTDSLGVTAWIPASPSQIACIKDDLIKEYLADLSRRPTAAPR